MRNLVATTTAHEHEGEQGAADDAEDGKRRDVDVWPSRPATPRSSEGTCHLFPVTARGWDVRFRPSLAQREQLVNFVVEALLRPDQRISPRPRRARRRAFLVHHHILRAPASVTPCQGLHRPCFVN